MPIQIARMLGCGLALLSASAGCSSLPEPVHCPREQAITLRVFPAAQINQDREGFARSVVLRIYQLQDARDFRASSFDAIWSTPTSTRPEARDPQSSARPEEWIVLPGQRSAHELPRDPTASHIAVAANFREHRGESGWRAVQPLPAPNDSCLLGASRSQLALDVVLTNYALQLR